MRRPPAQFAFAVLTCTTAPCSAQLPGCPPALTWSDYTYVQRTTTEGRNVAEAELRNDANAHVLKIRLDGAPVSIISMTSTDAEGIDVRNWRVYRHNVLLRESTSEPLTLGALIEEIGAVSIGP